MPVRANMCIPFFEPADRLTGRCTAAVRGKRFVQPSASVPGGMKGTENPRIAEATAASRTVIGVSTYDAIINEELPLINSNLVVPLTVGAAVVFNQPLTSDAQGRAVPAQAGEPVYAVALEDQATVGNDVGAKLKGF